MTISNESGLKNQSIIVFSSDDWGWKTSKYQLSIRFAKNNKVLFISSIGFRSPKASTEDFGRIWRKLKSFLRGLNKVNENLYVLTPLVIPFSWVPFKDRLNIVFLKIQIALASFKLNMSNPYFFVFSQNWYDYIKGLDRKKLIYYCVDEHSGFGGLDEKKFIELDKKMNKKADVIFCSSISLYNKNKQHNSFTYHIPHGVNFDLFASSMNADMQIADDIQAIRKPIFLFFGHISYDWVDSELVKYLAKSRPDYSWVFIGRYSMEEGEFEGFNNIHLLGEKKYEDLPHYCAASDVGIIPFVYSELTENCHPLKLPEYVSAGLPVVSTDIPEVKIHYGDITYLAKNDDKFLSACDNALDERDKKVLKERSLEMKKQSWDRRVQSIYKIINETGDL